MKDLPRLAEERYRPTIKRWSEFEPTLERIRERWDKGGPRFSATLFRGLPDGEMRLETTLERWHPNERSLLNYYAKTISAKPLLESLGSRRWDKIPNVPLIKTLLETNEARSEGLYWFLNKRPEIYEYLVYLRHHGFPSPLLDWTASPYVAAFFAFDKVAEKVDAVCIYAVLPGPFSRPGSLEEYCYFVGPYLRTHSRHVLQQSHYSICAGWDAESQWCFRPHENAILGAVGQQEEVFKITIPVGERLHALKHLDSMNINPFSLFGDEDSLVRTIARRECEFKDWNL